MSIPNELQEIAKKVAVGESPRTTIRTLLAWFGMQRRTSLNVYIINRALEEARVATVPDFEELYLDGFISFEALDQAASSSEKGTQEATEEMQEVAAKSNNQMTPRRHVDLPDAAHRISRLASANRPPEQVAPDATIEEAVTLMLCHDYSQLPVMQSEREVKGLFSWKSLGSRLAVGEKCACVREGMDDHREIRSDESLFKAVGIIAEYDCVLVRGPDKKICGIVTAHDISAQFHQLAEPFLLLGDIENHIRYLISNAFTIEELQDAKDPGDESRIVEDISSLTLGEYVRLLQNEGNWAKLDTRMDRKTVTAKLEDIQRIRNDVMHFDPDPMPETDLQLLRDIARFLARRKQITS